VLVEGLVALVLLALTLGLLAGMVSFGRRVAEAGRGRDQVAQLANGVEVLGQWLAAAAPVTSRTQVGPGPVLFSGTSNRLTFVTLSKGDVQPAGLLAIAVASAPRGRNGQRGGLMFATSAVELGAQELPDLTPREVLIDHLTTARFSYFGSRVEGEPMRWYDEWNEAARLPRLVALRAGLQDAGTPPLDLTFRLYDE
jgi:hypothetical protein